MSITGSSHPRQCVVHTDDLDRVQEAVSGILTNHRTSLIEGSSGLDVNFSATTFDKITVIRLEYGAAVKIDVDPPDHPFQVIQWPLRGTATVASGREQIVTTPDVASLPDPHRVCTMHLAPKCAKVALRIEEDHLQRHLQSLIGRPARDPVIFDLGMDLQTSHSRTWRATLDLLIAETQCAGGLFEHPLVAPQVESVILTGLLLAQRHNYTAALCAQQIPAAPRAVKRVLELIESNPQSPLSVEELAAGAGVSVRSLQKGFHDMIGRSPMAYLREVRLNRAYEELRVANPSDGGSVTEVALNWGFTHLGRFSVEYRRRFGESPSQTLRR